MHMRNGAISACDAQEASGHEILHHELLLRSSGEKGAVRFLVAMEGPQPNAAEAVMALPRMIG